MAENLSLEALNEAITSLEEARTKVDDALTLVKALKEVGGRAVPTKKFTIATNEDPISEDPPWDPSPTPAPPAPSAPKIWRYPLTYTFKTGKHAGKSIKQLIDEGETGFIQWFKEKGNLLNAEAERYLLENS